MYLDHAMCAKFQETTVINIPPLHCTFIYFPPCFQNSKRPCVSIFHPLSADFLRSRHVCNIPRERVYQYSTRSVQMYLDPAMCATFQESVCINIPHAQCRCT